MLLARVRCTIDWVTASALRARWSTSDRKSTRLNSSHLVISYAVFCLKKKKVRPAYPAGAASRAGVPARRASGSRLGLRLSGLHAHGRRPRAAGAREAGGGQRHRPEHPDRVGRRLSPGACRQLSLRLRLLASAAGIVAVSLLLAGALTWVVVRDLEFQSAQAQLSRNVITVTAQVRHEECFNPLPRIARPGTCPRPGLDTPSDFVDRLTGLVVPTLSGNRLLLLRSDHSVVFDSQDSLLGRQVSVGAGAPGRYSLDGHAYFTAAQQIPPGQDPLHASFVVLAQPPTFAASAAAGELASRLPQAGGAGVVVAMLLTLLISQSMTRPLTH